VGGVICDAFVFDEANGAGAGLGSNGAIGFVVVPLRGIAVRRCR
jgi:hypothetical protein